MKKNHVNSGAFLLDRFKGRSLKTYTATIPSQYFACSKFDLESIQKPTQCMKAIKERFWRLNLEWQPGTKLSVHDLHRGICSYQHFYHNVLRNPVKWCWILRNDITAPICFRDVEAQLTLKLGEVLKLPVTKNNKAIIKNVKAIIETADVLLDLLKK